MPAPARTPEIVLFDLDGVLVDSRRAIHHSVQAAVDDAGLGWTLDYLDDVRPIIGPPMGQGLRDLLLRRGGDPELAPEFVRAYRRHYAEVALSDSSLYAGIPEALDELRVSRKLLVATSKPQRFADMLLDGLGIGGAFAAVLGPASDWTPETKGATITRALTAAGAGGAVMIGDTAYDAVGAAENGIPCIGALWGFGTSEELEDAGASPLLERPGQIPPPSRARARLVGRRRLRRRRGSGGRGPRPSGPGFSGPACRCAATAAPGPTATAAHRSERHPSLGRTPRRWGRPRSPAKRSRARSRSASACSNSSRPEPLPISRGSSHRSSSSPPGGLPVIRYMPSGSPPRSSTNTAWAARSSSVNVSDGRTVSRKLAS